MTIRMRRKKASLPRNLNLYKGWVGFLGWLELWVRGMEWYFFEFRFWAVRVRMKVEDGLWGTMRLRIRLSLAVHVPRYVVSTVLIVRLTEDLSLSFYTIIFEILELHLKDKKLSAPPAVFTNCNLTPENSETSHLRTFLFLFFFLFFK